MTPSNCPRNFKLSISGKKLFKYTFLKSTSISLYRESLKIPLKLTSCFLDFNVKGEKTYSLDLRSKVSLLLVLFSGFKFQTLSK